MSKFTHHLIIIAANPHADKGITADQFAALRWPNQSPMQTQELGRITLRKMWEMGLVKGKQESPGDHKRYFITDAGMDFIKANPIKDKVTPAEEAVSEQEKILVSFECTVEEANHLSQIIHASCSHLEGAGVTPQPVLRRVALEIELFARKAQQNRQPSLFAGQEEADKPS